MKSAGFVFALIALAALPAPGPVERRESRLVAEGEGVQGQVRVEERDGGRTLLIGGVPQGALPIEPGLRSAGGDPLVGLVTALRPKARSALVIGLGTGRTAAGLAAAGLTVEAVELEPLVVEYAREHFGYRGHAVVSDGLAYLEANERRWDVLVLDAFTLDEIPAHLADERALGLMRSRVAEHGLLAVRTVGSPGDERVTRLARGLGEEEWVAVFGGGVGAERQNLYLIWSEPGGIVGVRDLPLWPLPSRPVSGEPAAPAGDPEGASRRVSLVGYLIRATETGELCLDLPHQEMGAYRYVVSGRRSAQLARLLPETARFPTQGDIHSDGSTAGTLAPLLGGGGAKRSDIRFSPVVAAVEGTARLRSLVSADAVYGGRPLGAKVPLDPLLPYGGAVYELEVDEILWTFDFAGWRALRGKLMRPLKAARAAARRGDLGAASRDVGRYLAVMDARFGPQARRLPLYVEVAGVMARLDRESGHDRSPMAIASACDRAQHGAWPDHEDGAALHDGLRHCATERYARLALSPDEATARVAAARLLELRDESALPERARARFPGLAPLTEPPRPGTP
jgi:SAM-dependent methyltransferase